ILADDHALVHGHTRADEQRAALLEVPERVGDARAVGHADHDAAVATANRTGPGSVPAEPVVQHALAARVGEELAAVAEQSTRGHAIHDARQARALALTGAAHLEHLAAPAAELLDDDADERFRHVDHDLLVRLEQLAVRALLRDDARARDGELVALTPHRLHQDAEVQLAAAAHRVRIGRVGVLDAQRDVALQLLVQ